GRRGRAPDPVRGPRGPATPTGRPPPPPPPAHHRSRSTKNPSPNRHSTSLPRISPKRRPRSKARIAPAVGMTQLTLSETQLQPYFEGSKRTCVSVVRNLRRQSQKASPGSAAARLWSALGKQGCLGVTCANALAMMAVGQFPPELNGAIEDHPPSGN